MLSVIIGGAGSGKSAFAEDLVCRLPGQRLYIATMTAKDAESLRRIAKHREARAGRGFQTLERGLNLAGAVEFGDGIPKQANVLLEDLANLLANEMFGPNNGGPDAVWRGLEGLRSRCASLTVVSSDVFSGGRNPSKQNLPVGRPDSTSAVISAVGPGIVVTGMP